jgi:hypothetical protein
VSVTNRKLKTGPDEAAAGPRAGSRADPTPLSGRDPGLLDAIVADGRPLLQFTAFALLFAGCFALFLSIRREFLPHDIAFLRMTPDQLCAIGDCRVVAFMFHDRVAFGGVLVAIATLYLWLTAVPLGAGVAWAWWTLAVSGVTGFLSFLAYLGHGYLDTWHGVGSAFLLPVFSGGLLRSRQLVRDAPPPSLVLRRLRGRRRLGQLLLLATGAGMLLAGATILVVGMTRVFVPQDLAFMGLAVADLDAANPRLVSLIAHDRAGFGGGLVSCGSIVTACALFGAPSRSLWQALAVAGIAGFGAAIAVHLAVGYTDVLHLAPAIAGALLFAVGLVLVAPGPAGTQAGGNP